MEHLIAMQLGGDFLQDFEQLEVAAAWTVQRHPWRHEPGPEPGQQQRPLGRQQDRLIGTRLGGPDQVFRFAVRNEHHHLRPCRPSRREGFIQVSPVTRESGASCHNESRPSGELSNIVRLSDLKAGPEEIPLQTVWTGGVVTQQDDQRSRSTGLRPGTGEHRGGIDEANDFGHATSPA